MIFRIPITTLAQLDALDEAEIIEGYWDGKDNFPCGNNRSISYWHGWRNGMADGKHAEIDEFQRQLAHVIVESYKKSA